MRPWVTLGIVELVQLCGCELTIQLSTGPRPSFYLVGIRQGERDGDDDLPIRIRCFGYARVSTDDQDLSLQIDALIRFGIDADDIFTDKISGAKEDRPGLSKCLNTLQAGDTLVVWRLDRLGRSMRHLVTLIEELREQNIGFKSISDGAIDMTSASGEMIFNFFAALAQFERRLIQERTKAGLAAAHARGRKGGRRKMSPDQPRIALAQKLYEDKSISLDDICETLKVSRSTLYHYVRIARKATDDS